MSDEYDHPIRIGDPPVLVSKSLAEILTFWVPGSGDWPWSEEYHYLITRDDNGVTARVRERIAAEGFGFLDHIAPVMLGSDGRVWDGHHRICLAIEQRVPSLMTEIVSKNESSG